MPSKSHLLQSTHERCEILVGYGDLPALSRVALKVAEVSEFLGRQVQHVERHEHNTLRYSARSIRYLHTRISSINWQANSRNPSSVFTCEEHSCSRNILWRTQSLERMSCCYCRFHLLCFWNQHTSNERCLRVPRTQCIDMNAMRCTIHRTSLRESHHGVL